MTFGHVERRMRKALGVAVIALVLAACTVGPTLRPAGSPVAFAVIAEVNGRPVATVAVTDTSGRVDGVTSIDPTTLGLSTADWQTLNAAGALVVGVPGSNDIALLWSGSGCNPDQTVHVSEDGQHLKIDVHQVMPPGDGACEGVGAGPTLRLAMAAPIDVTQVIITMTDGNGPTRVLTNEGRNPVESGSLPLVLT